MTEDADLSLGGADEGELIAIARVGTLPDSDDDPLPWDECWMETFDSWSREANDCGETLLLFSPTPAVIGRERRATKRVLLAQQNARPAGVYIVGRPATSHAWEVATASTFQAACQFVESDTVLNCLPTVIIGRRRQRMCYFPTGLGADTDGPTEIRLDRHEDKLDWPHLREQLTAFESECLNTNEMIPKVWKDPKRWHPIERAEQVIHGYLLVALRMVFRRYTTASEVNVPVGRADLLLIPRDPMSPTRAVVELKVLRTFSCSGETTYGHQQWEAALAEGRRQACSYAQDTGAELKVLCSYDMRQRRPPEVLEQARVACEREGVTLHSSPVYNSVAAVRVDRQC